jgi:hypothetical protein
MSAVTLVAMAHSCPVITGRTGTIAFGTTTLRMATSIHTPVAPDTSCRELAAPDTSCRELAAPLTPCGYTETSLESPDGLGGRLGLLRDKCFARGVLSWWMRQ